MPHDFVNYPELLNSEFDLYYFNSPFPQITENFTAVCVKVHDGDTITAKWSRRDFPFPIRFVNIAAPELSEDGGPEAQEWLEDRLLGREIEVVIDPNNRVEKWGRLLGRIFLNGSDVGEEEVWFGLSKPWKQRKEGKIINPIKPPTEVKI